MTAAELQNEITTIDGPRTDDLPISRRQIALALRSRILALAPAEIGLEECSALQSSRRVWGVLIETAHPDAVASLAVLADGSVSLYVSDGNGCVGCGTHREVRLAAAELLEVAERSFPVATATDDTDYPPRGYIRFYFLSFQGLRSAQLRLEEVNATDAQLAELYFAGQRVLSCSERVGAGQSLTQEIRRLARDMAQEMRQDPAPTEASTQNAVTPATNQGERLCSFVGSAAHRSRT